MTHPPAKCIFCGSLGPLTDEHIFSRWTHKFLPPRSMTKYHKLDATIYPDIASVNLIKRPGDIRDWQIKCVCETNCNNGWMRRLENAARRIMIPLILGQDARLHANEQKIVAAWAAMKAMIAEYDPHGCVTTHHTHRQLMMTKRVPPKEGWAIWIGHYIRRRWVPHWGSIPFLFLSDKQQARRRPKERATYYNSHISTQVVGQLFIHVIRSPARQFVDQWRFSTPDKGALLRIWPISDYSLSWPFKTMTDRDADYVVGALKEFLEGRTKAKLTR